LVQRGVLGHRHLVLSSVATVDVVVPVHLITIHRYGTHIKVIPKINLNKTHKI